MDDLQQQARDALLKAIAQKARGDLASSYLRDLAEAYQRVTEASNPAPPTPIGVVET